MPAKREASAVRTSTLSSHPPTTATLTDEDKEDIAALNDQLAGAYQEEAGRDSRSDVLRRYVALRHTLTEQLGEFGLVNNRIYRGSDGILIPYIVGHTLLIYRTPNGSAKPACEYSGRPGLIITDEFIKRLGEFEGDPIDLETELLELDTARCQSVRVSRIRDMAAQLERISRSANYADAMYLLRLLVARLSLYTFKKNLSAKNLQTEVHTLITQVLRFLDSPLSYQLTFLSRILVRNISGVVTKPKLIDRLWNDAIDLDEVQVRGSSIVNEIRRSAHHAMGKRTLLLAKSYLEYLESGNRDSLTQLGHLEPGPVDEAARQQAHPKELVKRILSDLEELLGSSDVLSRIREWQATHTETLIRCQSGKSLTEEVEEAVASGIGKRNRWTFYHHLRIIRNRVAQFPLLRPHRETTERCLQALLTVRPDEPGFDAVAVEEELRRCVDGFIRSVQSAYQEELFGRLEELTSAFHQSPYYATFQDICQLRKDLNVESSKPAFPEQRLLLYELDCLLEEIGYVTLRHVASRYEEEGVDLPQCLQVIHWCALNLAHDGLSSRQLLDLGGMLLDGSYTYAELANVLRQIQREYQQVLRLLIAPFEKMKERLELDEEELRISMANMQRFLHDFNNLAFFADTALSHIEHHIADTRRRIDDRTSTTHPGDDLDGIVHLSHIDEIRDLILRADPTCNLRATYGGKGSGLIYIGYLNIPTADGFIIPTTAARRRSSGTFNGRLDETILEHLAILETDIAQRHTTQRRFGQSDEPILLAVRGGSVFSMPGILTTVVFVGMNDEIVETLARVDPWHAYDSYRRFLASFGEAVWGVDIEAYNLFDKAKERYGVKYKDALPWEAMRDITDSTKEIFQSEGFGEPLEEVLHEPRKQLLTAVRAVFDSWNRETAKQYRELKSISDAWQSAVIVQEMASGNRQNEVVRIGMDESKASLTGVIPRTVVTELGMRECTGEFKFSACGDDLVGGLTSSGSFLPWKELASYMPMLNRRLNHAVARLRHFMGADQEIEFTVENGVLSVLQSRAAEVGSNERNFAFEEPGEEATRGIGIRGSAFRGLAAFDEADCQELKEKSAAAGDEVDGVLMLLENPTPADIPLILQAEGLLTSKGGSTSHAAIAINGLEAKDFSAVMSARRLHVNAREHEAVILDERGQVEARIRKGDVVSIDGSLGVVYVGTRPVIRT